jgi:hypothetical protein
MTLKYCQGNARQAESVFGWGRETVKLGLNEHRTDIICLGMQSVYGGDKLWEEKHPEVAQALWALAELHSQQDQTFRTSLPYTRLTAAEALKQLRSQGFHEDQLPSPSIVDEDEGTLHLTFGSSFKTSNLVVDSLIDGGKTYLSINFSIFCHA